MSSDDNDEEFQDSDSSYGSSGSDSDGSYGKKKKSKGKGKASKAKATTSKKKGSKKKDADDDPQIVKRTRRANDDLTDDDVKARVLECFSQRPTWSKKNLRLTLGIQLWKFQKFLDEMCEADESGEYFLRPEFRAEE